MTSRARGRGTIDDSDRDAARRPIFRAYSARRFFGCIPRARRLTLGYNVSPLRGFTTLRISPFTNHHSPFTLWATRCNIKIFLDGGPAVQGVMIDRFAADRTGDVVGSEAGQHKGRYQLIFQGHFEDDQE